MSPERRSAPGGNKPACRPVSPRQKVEGNVTYHTARSTASPQPAPGTAAGPGPMKVLQDFISENQAISAVGEHRGAL
jgi:hypothetical protein